MKNRLRKHKAYAELSARKKKNIYISIKNQIPRAAPFVGGLFYSHDYLHGENGWVDGYFIGKNRTVYNFALQTTRYAYKEAVSDAAFDATDERVPRPPIRFERDPKTGYSTMVSEPDVARAEFDGLRRWDWIKEEERRIADAGTVKVVAEVTLHRDYYRGIGLHGTLDVPSLTVDAINAFIRQFLETEAPSRAAEPISYRHDEIKYWGLESNAIVEPWECPPNETPSQ
jgi:hypothetical protein